ncbi:SDR family oxidoreductase [Halomonas sp. McH1-25]|uniref:SDR family oxidoreductase n=1 Tax=unclassified Halomonas TaxID=2609666 RepID=UPI001EF527BB|nr:MULTISPECIES: SDR family oxidoreductase [unclassified Halomonas]MCG7600811.1 SDR family oxidoreductase [Halomonas sp. McH1-25]MCP1344322.1 SDR family oxidoreductase [Halomonas sp. FL8]MCP1363008.1 SDR family oxidoreductase [Halomonas sp. BBD45]
MTQAMQKTWFITGASSGLGRAMTEQLLERGDRVAATLRRPERLDELKTRYGDRLWVAGMDVTDTAAIRATTGRAFAELGRIDVVVSNAGYGLFGAGEELTDEQIQHQLETNLIGSIQLIRAVLPHLREQGGGRIIQVSSEGGQIAYPNFSLYHASKWGIEGFVESVAQEVAPFGIAITLAEPGPTATNFAAGLVSPEPMTVYDKTPAGDVRRALANGTFGRFSDGDKVARAMIDSADLVPAPKRQVYGSEPWQRVGDAYRERLAALESQRAVAASTDADA